MSTNEQSKMRSDETSAVANVNNGRSTSTSCCREPSNSKNSKIPNRRHERDLAVTNDKSKRSKQMHESNENSENEVIEA